MRIAVTGASGNIGTALLIALGGMGEHALVGVSRRPPPQVPPYEWAQWHRIDIGRADAADRLTEAFAGVDAVVHLAWQLQPSSVHSREAMRRTNQDGTAAVVEAARRAGVAHFVHQSSIGAYAPGSGRLVDETWPVTGIPTSSYSVDKAAAEVVVDALEDHCPVTRMRPGLVFQDAAASEISRYFLGPLVPSRIIGPGLMRFVPLPQRLAFQAVHADDVATAIALVLEQRAAGAFNVAAEPVIDRTVWREVFGGVGPQVPVAALRAVAAATWRARLQPTEPGWIDLAAQAPTMKTDRLRELGWEPRRSAAETLERFIRAMRRGAGRPGPLLAPRGDA
jgi:UDP-glucose 4-epimerase